MGGKRMTLSQRMASGLILIALSATVLSNLTKSKQALAAIAEISSSVSDPQQIVQGLNPEQISLRAKQIAVRIDGAGIGSGVIIGAANNVYTVLTNWHVVKNPGQYKVQTIDGREHPIETTTVRHLVGLDLAILQFTSNQNYQLAEIGNSDELVEGQSLYFAGYPSELREEDGRYYRFFTTNLVGILPKSTDKGYALIYNGEAFPGMSGGPVFDKYGRLIGIHGEANINAITGATSIYAIPINTYKQANSNPGNQVATTTPNNTSTATNSSPETVNQNSPEIIVDNESGNKPASAAANPTSNSSSSASTPENLPEVTVETKTENNPQSLSDNSVNNSTSNSATVTQSDRETRETTSNPQSENNSNSSVTATPNNNQNSSVPLPTIESEGGVNSSKVSSVPTFTPSISTNIPDLTNSNNSENSTNSSSSDVATPPTQLVLISSRTGIDYTSLRNLLAEGKWEEADRQTYDLIEQIIKTAKRRNPHMFIELKAIAEFSCTDIKTIDQLWRKYSGGRFGFTPQQHIWKAVNQNGDFSTETWRSFATQVGWKQGEVASSSGYLLYEQLNFDPATASMGHLPWWFALPQEYQDVIKHLFARCNFDGVESNTSEPSKKNE
jgi:hypothetical protein